MDTTIPELVTPGGASPSGASYQVQDALRLLRRRWKLVIAVAVSFVAIVVGVTLLRTPIYAAHTTLLIKATSQSDVFNPQQDQFGEAQRRVATEAAIIKSSTVAAAVKGRIGSAPTIAVSGSSDSDIITITARNAKPQRAADVANAYAAAYVDAKRKQGIDDLLAASNQVRARVDDIQKQIDALDHEVEQASPGNRDAVIQSVSQQRSSLLNQQSGFGQTLDELQVRIALASGGASVVGPAVVPSSPVEPRPVRTGLLALIIGLLMGICAAIVRENIDDRIRSKDDLERASNGLPVLGVITTFDSNDDLPIALSQPSSTSAEAYRTLRTSVQFLGLDRRLRVLQVTSPNAGEGKTTTITNLGVALACAGVSVCIVDCDLRRPRLASTFGVSSSVGFTSVLLGQSTLDNALLTSEELGPYLRILPSGPVPPNPSELLSSTRLQAVIEALVERFDIVLIDSPPTLPVSDALVVSRLADAVLLVTTAGATTRRGVQRAVEVMGHVAAPMVGTVLNRADEGGGTEYGYGYGEYTSDAVSLTGDGSEPAASSRSDGRTGRGHRRSRREVGASS